MQMPLNIPQLDQPIETKTFAETLSGEAVLVGFETVLADILEE